MLLDELGPVLVGLGDVLITILVERLHDLLIRIDRKRLTSKDTANLYTRLSPDKKVDLLAIDPFASLTLMRHQELIQWL